ncbi:inosine 5'-monophosphate dehydrogenase [Pseudobythopirellula maris]|uniref:Inosine 5'-monophosphate dehydrogenase n=1 Tax=Pseudobythopirellula maris TaxID=2527991 RepID=A0A5C5ZN19_9BACT|nr:CBS domain-containing protein [Pseudobythopirellula maris]TWT88894.1 inosine 5'-monophosphate dehydrogenase [Pseudobythopirellula maris]
MDFQLSLQSEKARSAHPDQPLAIDPGASLGEAISLLRAQKSSAVMVCEGDQLVGIFTERDALRLMAGKADFSAPVSSAMSPEPVTVDENATLAEAIQLMTDGGYRHLPLMSGDGKAGSTPIGSVDVRGIVHYLVEHFPNTIYNLPPSGAESSAEREGA